MSTKTSKILKLVGKKKFIEEATGKVVEMDVVEVKRGDANFQKIWVSHILEAVEELSSKKLRVVMHLVAESAKHNNVIPTTVTKLARDLGMSRPTVTETLQILERNEIVRRQTGAIWVNPDIVFKGSYRGRMNVLMTYKAIPKSDATDEERIERAREELKRLNAERELLCTHIEALEKDHKTPDELKFDPMDPTTFPPSPC